MSLINLVVAAVWHFTEHCRVKELGRRVLPFVAVTVAWGAWHPILLPRLMHPHLPVLSAEPSLPAWLVAEKTAQAMLNVDQLGGALIPSLVNVVGLGLGALFMAAAVHVAVRRRSQPVSDEGARGLIWTGCTWAAAGWLPLFMPSVGWHAYYGCLGAVGAVLVAPPGGARGAVGYDAEAARGVEERPVHG